MGTINKGILGGFSGKVGSVVGGTWKGIDYMRSKSNRKNFLATDKQLAQQMKFSLLMGFLQPMAGLLSISFRDFAVKMTGINNAFSYNYEKAITGVYPALSIDYSNALVSRGSLPNATGPAVTSGAGSILTFNWTDNSGVGGAASTDQAIFVAYCPGRKQCIFTTAGGARNALTGTLNLVPFSGQQVQTYIGFLSADEMTVSDSYFTGQVTVS